MNDVAFYIRLYYALAITGIVFADSVPVLRNRFIQYGKTRAAVRVRSSNAWLQILDIFAEVTIPKTWFCHFYTLCILSCFASMTFYRQFETKSLLPWTLVLLQSTRRVTEELAWPSTNQSQMWAGHYIVGLLFYVCVSWSTVCTALHAPSMSVNMVAAIILFVGASIWQTQLHRHLATLKSATPSTYSIPSSKSFKVLLTPHYTAEILIYFAVTAAADFRNDLLTLALIWTIINLSISAKQTKAWAEQRWGNQWRPRWNIIPFVY